MKHYIVKSPWTGHYFMGPWEGVTDDVGQAHAYPDGNAHLRWMVQTTNNAKEKLILREAPTFRNCTVENSDPAFGVLVGAFEEDIKANPSMKDLHEQGFMQDCEYCGGTGIDGDLYMCQFCDGLGIVDADS